MEQINTNTGLRPSTCTQHQNGQTDGMPKIPVLYDESEQEISWFSFSHRHVSLRVDLLQMC